LESCFFCGQTVAVVAGVVAGRARESQREPESQAWTKTQT
jgi:hypothetical protein